MHRVAQGLEATLDGLPAWLPSVECPGDAGGFQLLVVRGSVLHCDVLQLLNATSHQLLKLLTRLYFCSAALLRRIVCCVAIARACLVHYLARVLSGSGTDAELPTVIGSMAKALRGQDKLSLTLYRFLSKPMNCREPAADELLQSYCYKALPKWRGFFLEKLVGAYFACVRRFLLLLCHAQHSATVGDVLHFDCSRVACKEVMLVSMLAGGSLISLPLQTVPDQAALIDREQATEQVTNAMMGKKGRKKKNDFKSSRVVFIGLVHAILLVWPFASVLPWRATTIHIALPGSQRCVDVATGHYFCCGPRPGISSWCLPPELRHPGVLEMLPAILSRYPLPVCKLSFVA